jgi:hypothetical protein
MKLFILLGKDAVARRFLVNPPDGLPVEIRNLADEDPELASPWIKVTPDELTQRQTAQATAATAWRQQLDAAQAALATKELALAECQQARAQRYEAEASAYDLADAETKLASSDASVQAAGAAQKVAVLTARLAIKAALPKP